MCDNYISFLDGMLQTYRFLKEKNTTETKSNQESRISKWRDNLLRGDFEYDLVKSKAYLILRQPVLYKKGKRIKETYMCLFCGNYHLASLEEGLREAACSPFSGPVLDYIIHKNGITLYQKDGYIIKFD